MKEKKKGMELEKEETKKMKMSCDDDDICRPYKISFPGKYDPYELGPLKDPRLGIAQKKKDKFYKIHGFSDDDDDDDDDGSGCCEDDGSKDNAAVRSDENGADKDKDGDGEDGDESESESEDESSAIRVFKFPMPDLSSTPDSALPIMSTPKQSNNDKLIWKRRFKRLVQNEATFLKRRDCECAEAAMEFYNQKHGTDYEIIETLGSYRRIYLGYWFHCNFIAQRKSDPSQRKLFFAELQSMKLPNLIVRVCVPLDDPQNSSCTVRGCYMCGNQLLHPLDGFEAGNTYRSWFSCREKRPSIFF